MKSYNPLEELEKESWIDRGLLNPKNYLAIAIALPLILFLNYAIGHGVWNIIINLSIPSEFIDLRFWKVIIYITVALFWQAVFLLIPEWLIITFPSSIIACCILIFVIP